MQIDLLTLYYLVIGTLIVTFAMTLWERQAQPQRRRELGIWAAGYAAFAVGCCIGMNRALFPGVVGGALANVTILIGYLLVLQGVALLDGRRRRPRVALALPAMAILWATLGWRFPGAFWNHVSALPIALICGVTAWILLRSRGLHGLRSRPIAAAISAGHAAFYLLRALAAPLLVARYGEHLLPVIGKLTMYEGVLYSVALPMALLSLVREEAQGQLLAASRTDYLTGLVNRQGFFERGAQVLAGSRAGQPVSLLAFDLDHFKTINDRYGHAVGDEVLKLFAGVARDLAGPGAILVRLGGEEFAALLPGQGANAARHVGESVVRRFAERAAHSDGLGIQATVSIGLAERDSTGTGGLAELLSAADGALYRAKALGRNRIEAAAPFAAAA